MLSRTILLVKLTTMPPEEIIKAIQFLGHASLKIKLGNV